MTASGWIFMLVSWAAILGILVFCLVRTLRTNGQAAEAGPACEAGAPESPAGDS